MKMIPPPTMVTVHKWAERNVEEFLDDLFDNLSSPVNLMTLFVPYDEQNPDMFIAEWKGLVANTFYYMYETMKLVPRFHFDNDGDNQENTQAIFHMSNEILMACKMVFHKYSLLAQLMPPAVETPNTTDINDFINGIVNNYSVTTDNNSKDWLGEVSTETTGSISHSRDYTSTHGRDITTGSTQSIANDTDGLPKAYASSTSENHVNEETEEHNTSDDDTTTYNNYKITQSQPNATGKTGGKEFHQTKYGFYNSGSMSKILSDVRVYADFNILQNYVKDITSHITAYYA